MHARILCIGNRLFAPDSAGPLVFDLLADRRLPPQVEVVDGGLGGLNLLSCLESTDLVVFVDAVTGFRKTPGVIILDPLQAITPDSRYDHDAGLAYLLQAAPHVLDDALPAMLLVGIEGEPTPALCIEACDTCLALISARQFPKLPLQAAVPRGDSHA